MYDRISDVDKIIDFDELINKKNRKSCKKQYMKSDADLLLDMVADMVSERIKNKNNVLKADELDINNREVCCDECKELKVMKNKLKFYIPSVTIIYIILSSMSIVFFAFNLIIALYKDIVFINPYYSFCFMVGSIGLLITSVVSIYDWKEYIVNVKTRK